MTLISACRTTFSRLPCFRRCWQERWALPLVHTATLSVACISTMRTGRKLSSISTKASRRRLRCPRCLARSMARDQEGARRRVRIRRGEEIDADQWGVGSYWANMIRLLQVYAARRSGAKARIKPLKAKMASTTFSPYIDGPRSPRRRRPARKAPPPPRQLSLALGRRSPGVADRQHIARRLEADIAAFSANQRALPGVADPAARETLATQMVASLRRLDYSGIIRNRDISPDRADPNSQFFDPEKAAVHQMRRRQPGRGILDRLPNHAFRPEFDAGLAAAPGSLFRPRRANLDLGTGQRESGGIPGLAIGAPGADRWWFRKPQEAREHQSRRS